MRMKSHSAQNIDADSFLIAKYRGEVTFMWNTVTYNIGRYVVQPFLLYFQQCGLYSTHAIRKIFVSPEILKKSFKSAYLKKKGVQMLREHISNTSIMLLTYSRF